MYHRLRRKAQLASTRILPRMRVRFQVRMLKILEVGPQHLDNSGGGVSTLGNSSRGGASAPNEDVNSGKTTEPSKASTNQSESEASPPDQTTRGEKSTSSAATSKGTSALTQGASGAVSDDKACQLHLDPEVIWAEGHS